MARLGQLRDEKGDEDDGDKDQDDGDDDLDGPQLIFSTPKWPKLNFRDPPLFFPVDTEERMQEDKATQTGGM